MQPPPSRAPSNTSRLQSSQNKLGHHVYTQQTHTMPHATYTGTHVLPGTQITRPSTGLPTRFSFHSSFETRILPAPTFLEKLLESEPINSEQQTPILVIKTKCLTRQTIATHASIYSSTVHALDIVSHLVGNVPPCLPIETHTAGRRIFRFQGTVDAEAT